MTYVFCLAMPLWLFGFALYCEKKTQMCEKDREGGQRSKRESAKETENENRTMVCNKFPLEMLRHVYNNKYVYYIYTRTSIHRNIIILEKFQAPFMLLYLCV